MYSDVSGGFELSLTLIDRRFVPVTQFLRKQLGLFTELRFSHAPERLPAFRKSSRQRFPALLLANNTMCSRSHWIRTCIA